jgi:hypothetical protein
VIIQDRFDQRLRGGRLSIAFYDEAMARMEDRWGGRGDTGQRYLSSGELFADDLDIFGNGSLYQFLCTARSVIGKDTFAQWLKHPADGQEVRERQAAVRELSGCLELRERLAILELDVRTFRPAALEALGDAPRPLSSRDARLAGMALGVTTVIAVAFWIAFVVPLWVVLIILALEAGVYVLIRERLRPIHLHGYHATRTLDYLSGVQSVLNTQSFTSDLLKDTQSRIIAGGVRPIRSGAAIYGFMTQIPPLLLLLCQLVPTVDRWRRRTASQAQDGLTALGKFESLASLAQYAFERPSTTYPRLVDNAPCFEAIRLGHPLIPEEERVTNDLTLNDTLRLLMLSGSNMSGKSTMLRTVGINAVLALCGGPVCAEQLHISPFCIGTAMRFQDSLEHRTSHFFAVITRLHAVMQLLDNERPLLFLIDEILQGTNSRDREIGAEAVVRKLVNSGGVGLVTTHDLELTRIVDTLDGRGANVHFVDRLLDGEIHFDYKMRPGIVQTSNALALMRKLGLDV